MRISPVAYNYSNNQINFKKNKKEIIKSIPKENKELKRITKELTSWHEDFVLEMGIPKLVEYAKKGEKQKAEAINLLEDIIESKEMQKSNDAAYKFHGMPEYKLNPDNTPPTRVGLTPGYLVTYKNLTGKTIETDVKSKF